LQRGGSPVNSTGKWGNRGGRPWAEEKVWGQGHSNWHMAAKTTETKCSRASFPTIQYAKRRERWGWISLSLGGQRLGREKKCCWGGFSFKAELGGRSVRGTQSSIRAPKGVNLHSGDVGRCPDISKKKHQPSLIGVLRDWKYDEGGVIDPERGGANPTCGAEVG